MRYLFSRGCEAVLPSLLAGNPLLAFDFDGTLSPLVERPAAARLEPGTAARLRELAARRAVVVISGRSVADLAPRLAGIPLAGISGNHGVEPWGMTPETAQLVAGWVEALRRAFGGVEGVEIEDNLWSVTVDYRHAPDLEGVERRLCAFARALPRVRVLGGRHADLNLAPAGDHTKGTALAGHLRELGCASALYVGDDRTDEDIFGLDLPELVSIRIGQKTGSRARYFLHEQGEIDRLLDRLLALSPGQVRAVPSASPAPLRLP
jgi:trehalose 6-phosphate phosphatase